MNLKGNAHSDKIIITTQFLYKGGFFDTVIPAMGQTGGQDWVCALLSYQIIYASLGKHIEPKYLFMLLAWRETSTMW
jgi:hypothetical protein